MIIDVIVEIETTVGETVVTTTTTIGMAVATETAIEMNPDDSAQGRVAIAGCCGGEMIVDTFGTPVRIGDSSDSSGVEGGKRSTDERQRHKTRREGLCQFLPSCSCTFQVIPGATKR